MSAAPSKRLPQLDFLRGVAILLVLGAHASTLISVKQAGVFHPFASLIERFGWTGVDLFFVLSGFLVGGLLFAEIKRTGTFDSKRFIIRRGLKIWPAYYLFIGWFVCRALLAHHSLASILHAYGANLLHVQSYVPVEQVHTWSLAVEEHFYLLLPLVLGLLIARSKQDRLRRLPILFVLIALACLALRILALHFSPYPVGDNVALTRTVGIQTHLRIDALMFGVLIGYFYHLQPAALAFARDSAKSRWALLAAGLLLVSPALLMSRGDSRALPHLLSWGLTCLYLGYGCILLACVYCTVPDGAPGLLFRNPVGKAIGWIGVYSYGIYLWHLDQGRDRALQLLPHLSGMPDTARWFLSMLIYVVAAVAFGAAFSRIVEVPTLALRDRVFPDRSRA